MTFPVLCTNIPAVEPVPGALVFVPRVPFNMEDPVESPLRYRIFTVAFFLLSLFLLTFLPAAMADAISVQISDSALTTTSGGTVTFDGTVNNASGSDLNASNFFFNFFGFDPTAVNPTQDLGVATDFLIPNSSTSLDVALFDISLGPAAPGSTFPVEFQLEDINGDQSGTQTVTVSVLGSTPIPEPPTAVLILASFCAIAAMLVKFRTILL